MDRRLARGGASATSAVSAGTLYCTIYLYIYYLSTYKFIYLLSTYVGTARARPARARPASGGSARPATGRGASAG